MRRPSAGSVPTAKGGPPRRRVSAPQSDLWTSTLPDQKGDGKLVTLPETVTAGHARVPFMRKVLSKARNSLQNSRPGHDKDGGWTTARVLVVSTRETLQQKWNMTEAVKEVAQKALKRKREAAQTQLAEELKQYLEDCHHLDLEDLPDGLEESIGNILEDLRKLKLVDFEPLKQQFFAAVADLSNGLEVLKRLREELEILAESAVFEISFQPGELESLMNAIIREVGGMRRALANSVELLPRPVPSVGNSDSMGSAVSPVLPSPSHGRCRPSRSGSLAHAEALDGPPSRSTSLSPRSSGSADCLPPDYSGSWLLEAPAGPAAISTSPLWPKSQSSPRGGLVDARLRLASMLPASCPRRNPSLRKRSDNADIELPFADIEVSFEAPELHADEDDDMILEDAEGEDFDLEAAGAGNEDMQQERPTKVPGVEASERRTALQLKQQHMVLDASGDRCRSQVTARLPPMRPVSREQHAPHGLRLVTQAAITTFPAMQDELAQASEREALRLASRRAKFPIHGKLAPMQWWPMHNPH